MILLWSFFILSEHPFYNFDVTLLGFKKAKLMLVIIFMNLIIKR